MPASNYFDRYLAALHAMQSGVAMEMNHRAEPTSPKHLRVGINVAMCDHAALIALLIEKGLFTEEEYAKALAVSMEDEKARYEAGLSAIVGLPVTLG